MVTGSEEDAALLKIEIAWCLQHLEKLLENDKLPEKKGKEMRKARKLLKTEGTPLPQLRQVMRTQCGDYRARMKAEEEDVKLDADKIKFAELDLKKSKSSFLKKSVDKKCDEPKAEFKFNFSLPPS